MAEVVLKNITKIYDKQKVIVDNISLEIKDKEFLVLVGPSGCGKSTTLRMIAGLEDITSGELFIDGKAVNNIAPKDRDIAMVFQNYALYPHMTVYDNIAFGLKLRNYEKKEIEKRVMDAAEILELKDYLKEKPKSLSGGQRQRVAVGRAIVRQPKVFLFDEPLSNLDAKLRVQMRSELSKLHTKLQTTMIYVTHDQVEAMTMGDRIAVMHNGKIQQAAPPLEIYKKPVNKFTAGFIGSPAMNFVECNISKKEDNIIIDFCGIKITLPQNSIRCFQKYIDKKICAGIRPEDFIEYGALDYDNLPKITGKIEIIEQMGAESYYYFNIVGNSLVARCKQSTAKLFDNITLAITPEKISFFDLDTGAALEIN